MGYPQKHFFRHPLLVALVLFNYWQRKKGIKPDEWYWADRCLYEKTESRFVA